MRREKIKKYLENITPKAFEELCVDYMKLTRGDNLIIKGTRYVKDGGKDIVGTHESIPYEIWAECKKHSKSIGLSELSKNVVLVISENINELIYFSVSNITQDAQKHISNVAAKHGFGLSFYYGQNLLEEFLCLPLFRDSEIDIQETQSSKNDCVLNIKYYLSKYRYSSIYEKNYNISLQRDNTFYIDIFLKNRSHKKISHINCSNYSSPYFEYSIEQYNQDFSLNPGCDRVIQIKCEILNSKQKCKIPNLDLQYSIDNNYRKETLIFGFADAINVFNLPLVGKEINTYIDRFKNNILYSNDFFPYILNICGGSGVGKTRMIRELEKHAEKREWKIKRFDAKKQNDFYIIKDLLASFIGIPYYSGTINVSLENIKNIFEIHNKASDRAEKIYEFLFGESINNDLLYYIEDAFIYYLINPWYPVKYFVSIDNMQDLDERVISFLRRIFVKLENIENSIIFVLGNNTDFDSNIESEKLTNAFKTFDDKYCSIYYIEGMSYPDSLLLYSHALNNPEIEVLSLLAKKSGNRPFDIIMTIKYLQDNNLIKWKSNSTWYIENYDAFFEFVATIPKPNEDMLANRLSIIKKRNEYWDEFKTVIQSIVYFQGKVPIEFLEYINISDNSLEYIVQTAFVKYDDKSPDIVFFHDNILRFFSKKPNYLYNRKIANSIIRWIENLSEDEKPENINHVLFKCFLDTKKANLAYEYGIISAKLYESNYNYNDSNKIWSTILNSIALNVADEFSVRLSLANSYREHLNQNQGAVSFNELYDFYKIHKKTLNLTEQERNQFYHRLINANLITDNLQKALSIVEDFEQTNLTSNFYRLILFDRYALIYLGLGELKKSEENIIKAMEIAEHERNSLWQSIVYSDYGYISYRSNNCVDMTINYFEKAFNIHNLNEHTLHRKSELLHQKAFCDILRQNYESAYDFARESADLCHTLDSTFMGAKALNVLAISCLGLNRDKEAVSNWNKASYLCTLTHNINTHIRIYNNIGGFYIRSKDYKKAKENLEIALELFEKTKFHETSYKELFFNLLNLYFILDDEMKIEKLLAHHNFEELIFLYNELITKENKKRYFDVLRIEDSYFSF